MKKLISMLLALAMVLSLAACGNNNTPATEAPTQAPTEATEEVTEAATEEMTEEVIDEEEFVMELSAMETLLNQIVEIQPVEFMGGTMAIDLADTSEDGLWMIKNYTGLDNADSITEAAFFEPMMGSLAYSMVAVKVAEGADVKAIAEGMKNGIDQRKWICVEADDLQVASYEDIVLLIMVGSETGLTSQSYVDAFAQVCGGDVTTY